MFKRAMRVILSKTFVFALLALLQTVLVFVVLYLFTYIGAVAYIALTIITMVVLVAIFEQDDVNPAYKLTWIVVIVILPLAGVAFYLMWGHRHVPRRQQQRFDEIEQCAKGVMRQHKDVFSALKHSDKRMYLTARYLLRHADAPLYTDTQVEYYPIGEDFFPPFIEALQSAKKFIFLEYFIYEEGYMWNTVLGILRQKAAEGVDVRVIYDGFGSLFTLPSGYDKTLRSCGIQCYAFSPLRPTLHVTDYAMLNHRDHRKIASIDGEIAFSGGLNMADEYINVIERYGEWKDTAFMLRGQAAFSLTVSFLKTWDFVAGVQTDYDIYRPAPPDALPSPAEMIRRGLVQPYDDTPLDGENVAENVYLRLINGAERYVYISTPYLALDNEMITALSLAAKSGVDVRILTPGIPDKPTIFILTQSYYAALLRAGVRIYEYTPGFNHAKMYVCDDRTAVVGSANMDYRSLYLHFENCAIFYGGPTVAKAKADMLESFGRAHEVSLDETRLVPLGKRLMRIVVRFFAPML